jgi:preprotein translocase subunit SecG
MWIILLGILLFFTALFLIVLILIQRGKGGGLAGAFGGMGGQSAFGTKAGDLFTKITIGVATLWIVLCMVMVKVSGVATGPLRQSGGGQTTEGTESGGGESGGGESGGGESSDQGGQE